MKSYFEKYSIKVSDEKIELFEKFYNLLLEYNKKFNLTAITEREEVIIKHFVDSLLGVDNITGNKLIDIGSGGGFPAIPLKIFKPDVMLTMLDSTGKKCEFLNTVCKELEFKSAKAICGRAEELAKDNNFRESFDVCTARAVARLNTLLEYSLPFVKVGGYFIAYKGDATEEITEAQNAIKILGGKIEKVQDFELEGAKRQIIVIKKVKNTPKEYPRGNGKERKKPLWVNLLLGQTPCVFQDTEI